MEFNTCGDRRRDTVAWKAELPDGGITGIRGFEMAEKVLTFFYYCPVWLYMLIPIAAVAVMLEFHYYIKKWVKKCLVVEWAMVLFSVLLIIWITVLSRSQNGAKVNLRPFSFLFVAAYFPRILRAAFLNIVLYIPFGYSFGFCIKPKQKCAGVILVAFALSLLTELAQYIFSLGSAEVDDLILNTFGAYAGYLLHLLTEKRMGSESVG